MKKIILVSILFLFCWQSEARITTMVIGGSVPSGVSCASFLDISSCTGTGRNLVSTAGQFINNSSARTICKVEARNISEYGEEVTIHIEIWSTIDKTGTQYGGSSSQQTFSNMTWETKEFTWTTNKPNPTGDFYLHFVVNSGTANQIYFDSKEDCYSDGTYNAFTGGSITNRDASLKIYGE